MTTPHLKKRLRRPSGLPEAAELRLQRATLPDASLFARLQCVPLFQTLEDDVLGHLIEGFTLVSLPAEGLLLSSGQVNQHMYVLLTGRLRVHLGSLDTEPIAIVRPGDTVGELSVIDQRPTSAHVVASGDCELVRIDERGFWDLVAASHNFAVHLMHKLAERLRANNTAVLETSQLRDQFKRAALVDALTGIHNRRWLDETLPPLVDQHTRTGRPLCSAMIDVDHFKRFNDVHGHEAGDRVLRAVARTLQEQLRPSDVLARFGGEEFVVLFPNTDIVGAHHAAERLRRAVMGVSATTSAGAALPQVTISVGLAKLRLEPPQDLLKRADAALYRAKGNGRNRVESARADVEHALEPPAALRLDNTD